MTNENLAAPMGTIPLTSHGAQVASKIFEEMGVVAPCTFSGKDLGTPETGGAEDVATVREFEIGNPSDKCFLRGNDLAAVSMACLMLGGGAYCLDEVGGDFKTPIFLGSDPAVWFKATFGSTIREYLDGGHEAELAEAFESFYYPGERSSMNNIGGRAAEYARIIRAKLAQGTQARSAPPSSEGSHNG